MYAAVNGVNAVVRWNGKEARVFREIGRAINDGVMREIREGQFHIVLALIGVGAARKWLDELGEDHE